MKKSRVNSVSNSNSPQRINQTLTNQYSNNIKKSSIDLKKLNLNKPVSQSQSSLQLLILLLNKTLKMTLQQILGLFTNQNKYLAHIIVKGIKQQYNGLIQFYKLLIQNVEILKKFQIQQQHDVHACLYALKPGFISKNQTIVLLTLQLFNKFNNIYNWFIDQKTKSANTLLLGIKRHQNHTNKYIQTLFNIIQNNQINYFKLYYFNSFTSDIQFLSITTKIIKYLKDKQININNTNDINDKQIQTNDKQIQTNNNQNNKIRLIDQLQKQGIFQKWFIIVQESYQKQLQSKIIALQFIGQIMLYLPQIIQKNQIILHCIRQQWQQLKLYEFIPLFNQLLIILQKLAQAKSILTKKLYILIIDIFVDVYKKQQKRDYIVNGIISLLAQYPNIPSDMFINKYDKQKINSSDFILICEAIDISNNYVNLIKIGQKLKQIYFYNPSIYYYIGNLIIQIVKKLIQYECKQTLDYIQNIFKLALSNYVSYSIRNKNISKNNKDQHPYPLKNTKINQKQSSLESLQLVLITNYADLCLSFSSKLLDIVLANNISQVYINILKNYYLVANSQIKKISYNTGNKKIKSILIKKFNLSKQQQSIFQQQSRISINNQKNNKNTHNIDNIMAQSKFTNKTTKTKNFTILALSRMQVPQKITKQFDEIISKRKKQQQNKKISQQNKIKQEQLKKIFYQKQLQKMNLIRGGFGQGEAQIKQQGFWNKFIKQKQQIQIYTHDLIQDIELEATDLFMKKYNKLWKYIFFNFSNTMYTTKGITNFEQNHQRKQTLTAVQIIKFLKQYKLIFITNLQQVQILVRDINVKILHRKQIINQLDFEGFQQFIKQFCICCWRKPQKHQDQLYQLNHLRLPELLNNLIQYLKNKFKTKNQTLSFFDSIQPQLDNQSEQLKEINQKLFNNPNMILPQGYKKIIDKKINFSPIIKQSFNFPQSYKTSFQIFDQILYKIFNFHLIQSSSQKITKVTAKSFQSIYVKQRDPKKIKARALSTLIDKKTALQNGLVKIFNRNDLSKVIKKSMLLLKNQDKIIGQQVAFVLQQMLSKFDQQTIPNRLVKMKSLPKILDLSKDKKNNHKRNQSALLPIKTDRSNNHQKDFLKIKQQIQQRKKQKAQQQKKRLLLEKQKEKKKKQIYQQYLQEQKLKLSQKKKSQQQEKNKKKEQEILKKQEKKKNKQKFQEFNQKQLIQLKKNFQQTVQKKKKLQRQQQDKQQQNEQKFRKIRAQIQNKDKQITQIRKQTSQKILDFYHNPQFRQLVKQYQPCLKGVFQYLQKQTFRPLADKKCRQGEIDYQTWMHFNYVFQLSPLIISSKDIVNIFKVVTKDKNISKQYLTGLTFEEFQQALLRQCIKQKTVFTKITQRIKKEQPKQVNNGLNKKNKNVTQNKIPVKVQQQNQFQQEQQIDFKRLLKEQDIRTDIIDHYGDLSKFDIKVFKGLIYYLRMPFTKKGQQARQRQLIQISKKPESKIPNIDKLKEKLKIQYFLQKPQQKNKDNLVLTDIRTKQSKDSIQAKSKKSKK